MKVTKKSPLVIVNKSIEELYDQEDRVKSRGGSMEETASIPQEYLLAMSNLPEWQWVTESNENLCKFTKMNPQFHPKYRYKFGEFPPMPRNLDGSTLNEQFVIKFYLQQDNINNTEELDELLGIGE